MTFRGCQTFSAAMAQPVPLLAGCRRRRVAPQGTGHADMQSHPGKDPFRSRTCQPVPAGGLQPSGAYFHNTDRRAVSGMFWNPVTEKMKFFFRFYCKKTNLSHFAGAGRKLLKNLRSTFPLHSQQQNYRVIAQSMYHLQRFRMDFHA